MIRKLSNVKGGTLVTTVMSAPIEISDNIRIPGDSVMEFAYWEYVEDGICYDKPKTYCWVRFHGLTYKVRRDEVKKYHGKHPKQLGGSWV